MDGPKAQVNSDTKSRSSNERSGNGKTETENLQDLKARAPTEERDSDNINPVEEEGIANEFGI